MGRGIFSRRTSAITSCSSAVNVELSQARNEKCFPAAQTTYGCLCILTLCKACHVFACSNVFLCSSFQSLPAVHVEQSFQNFDGAGEALLVKDSRNV